MMWRRDLSLGQLTVPQQDIARMEFLDSDDLDAEAAQQREDRVADYYDPPALVPGTNAKPATHIVESQPRVHARGGEEPGLDGCLPAPTLPTR